MWGDGGVLGVLLVPSVVSSWEGGKKEKKQAHHTVVAVVVVVVVYCGCGSYHYLKRVGGQKRDCQ